MDSIKTYYLFQGKETAEKKLAESNKDKESLMYKIKTLGNERTRLQVLTNRNAPVVTALSQ